MQVLPLLRICASGPLRNSGFCWLSFYSNARDKEGLNLTWSTGGEFKILPLASHAQTNCQVDPAGSLIVSLCCGQTATRLSELQGEGFGFQDWLWVGIWDGEKPEQALCERTSANGSASTCDCPCSHTNLALSASATEVLQLLCFWSAHEILEHSALSETQVNASSVQCSLLYQIPGNWGHYCIKIHLVCQLHWNWIYPMKFSH